MAKHERLKLDEGDTRQITRQRRGRLISCPNCMRTFESMRRYRLECPRCRHAWTKRSSRNILDWLREQPATLAGVLFWVVPAMWFIGFIAAIGYSLVRGVDEPRDLLALAPIALVLLVLSATFLVIGKTRIYW